MKGDFVQAMQFIANQDGPECTVRNGNGVDLRCDIRRVCRDAIDEIEQITKDRDFWKRRADQRQITINELKQNPPDAPVTTKDTK